MSRAVAMLLLFIFVFFAAIVLSAYGIVSPFLGLLLAGIGAAVYFLYEKYYPDKQPSVPSQTGSTSGKVSFWKRETPLESEEQLETGFYAVTDKGYVQTAFLLSFTLPGTGQVYNRQYLKGIVFLILGLTLIWVVGLWALAIWLIGAVDAYLTARQIIAGKKERPATNNAIFPFMVFGMFLMLVLAWLFTTYLKRG